MPHMLLDDPCPSADELAAHIWGRLTSGGMAAIEGHVDRCTECRQLLSAIARTAATASLPGPGPGPGPGIDSTSPTFPIESGPADPGLLAGRCIGRYRVLDRLGAGGMGVVYSAHDPQLNRKVALKVLRNEGTGPADRLPIRDLLLREAQAMAQLAHPNVVTVFDVGSVDDRVFIAMELIEGQTLSRWLQARRRDHGEIAAAFRAAGNGLAAAHAAGLIHRDFKPDNVLIGNDGRICVTDFGLARFAASGVTPAHRGGAEASGGGSATRTGLAGTPAYMAPEQYRGQFTDARADQFSFAVALYEALYGERPFAPLQLIDRTGSPVVPAAPRGSDVPTALRRVLLRALSPEPDARYPSMRELLAAMGPAAPVPRRSGMVAGAAVVIAVATIVSAGAYALHLRRAAAQRAELVGRLRGLAVEMRTRLRSARMLPLHDVRPARAEVRSMLRDVEQQLRTAAGQDEAALARFVLGEGQRALGDHERARDLFEAAWAAGERGPQIDAALGYELGAAYESRLDQIERTVPPAERKARVAEIETRFRDPAMAHLRAALAARNGSPAFLEALIAFHDHRFAEASEKAHAVFTESPTFFEAGALEARAHKAQGDQLLPMGKLAEAKAEFAAARRIFQSVLEVARSDDEMWLGYAEMTLTQAISLTRGGEISPELRQEVIAALRNVQRINPDDWKAFLREAQIQTAQGNNEILWYRDPGPYVDKALALAEQARAQGADTAEVDQQVCIAHWEQAGYQGTHGGDPRRSFALALAACERAVAARPDADRHDSLGAVQCWLAVYEGNHGRDPTPLFDRCEHNFRAAFALGDTPGAHYSLGRLWTMVAHQRVSHGQAPLRAVEQALAEYEATVRMSATRPDAWVEMANALAARAQFELHEHQDTQRTLTGARAAIERALAIEPNNVPAVRYRVMLDEVEAEALVRRNIDPTPALARIRADVQLLSSRAPTDSFAHLMGARVELVAARWALAHHDAVDRLLTRAATEAARAQADDPMNALAWTASAEIEQVRIQAARARRATPSTAAMTHGRALVDRAMAIDPQLVRMLEVRNELARQAQPVP